MDAQPTEPAHLIKRLNDLDAVIFQAADKADLPKRGARGFDGTEWLWIWSDTADPSRTAEVRVRSRLISRQPGGRLEDSDLEVVVIGFAWLTARPDASWAYTYGGVRLRPEMSADELMTRMADWLNDAWKEAHSAAAQLGVVVEQRDRARALLGTPKT